LSLRHATFWNFSQREYVCSSCGHTEHRDINAARNIQLYGNELNTAGTAESASGVDLVLDVLSSDITNSAMKEEATMALA